MLEVAITRRRRLKDVVVRNSSGYRNLDQAAIEILRMAAPFDPFPQRLRADYDVLRFAYEWHFGPTGRPRTRHRGERLLRYPCRQPMGDVTYLTGHLLIAMPAMADPNFVRSVTYICEHTEQGALGIVINRPLPMDLGDVFRQLALDRTDSSVAVAAGPARRTRADRTRLRAARADAQVGFHRGSQRFGAPDHLPGHPRRDGRRRRVRSAC